MYIVYQEGLLLLAMTSSNLLDLDLRNTKNKKVL
jgi:hypothetical protein